MKYYIADAFTDKVFAGNPAGVCIVERYISDETMQKIAAENNLAETAFVKPRGGEFDLRWFTPEVEIDLCGHATLAAAFILSTIINPTLTMMRFHTQSGVLTVNKKQDLFEMNFPARMPVQVPVTELMEQSLGVSVTEAHMSRDLLMLVKSEEAVRTLAPNLALLAQIPGCFAAIVTAKGTECDFVSRFFAPNAGIPEDPVTGSSHSTLIPFWAERLQKRTMLARQLSKRGGTLYCAHNGERVAISGHAALYLSGEIL